LRDRFEYYINGLGEITAVEVRSLIEDEARRELGAALAARIMAVFDAYWLVRNHTYASHLDMADTGTWLPALREVQDFRKRTMGEAWARAFFAEDDQEFMASLEQVKSGQPPPPSPRDPVPLMEPGKDPQALRAERVSLYGEAVADRLGALDVEQAQFDSHVAEARSEWSRLEAQPELSEPVREARLKAFIAARVSAENRRRALMLVLPDSPTP
jgi:lipase chaperone LimK